MATHKKKCACCGKPFETIYRQRKYCNDQCAYEINRRTLPERNRRHSEKKRQVRNVSRAKQENELVMAAVVARKAGMTYGQYEAWQQSQKEMAERQKEREQGIRFFDRYIKVSQEEGVKA